MKWFVYKIECEASGKVYVGSTSRFKIRIRRHFTELLGDYHHSKKMQDDYKKHGKDSFKVVVLSDHSTIKEARKEEDAQIERHNAVEFGYNTCTTSKNFSITPEHRRSVEKQNLERIFSTPEYKEKCRQRATRQFSSEEVRLATSDRQKQFVARNPDRAKEIARMGGLAGSKAARETVRRPIRRSDGLEFAAVTDAAKFMNKEDPERARACIKQALKRGNLSLGFKWFYMEKK
jgi:group I intron endonuclease